MRKKAATGWRLVQGFNMWRVGSRHDESSSPLFPADYDNVWRGQDAISTEILLTV